MKREYQIGNDQLIDHILKLWNLGLEESQRALIDLIRNLDETTRQEVLQVLENSVSGEGRATDRLKASR
ncbi:hypothetical protein SAMN05216412_1048 [Nitrosospira multiformis]|uniref:Uncharacterized protein n=1 Tax=Nitrosospira multiformis TaxID=1231 RepID=A0A1I0CNL2_9PROT|nr:hypothetical protein SAMN05216412_1048 [Nitrosospira multiformis]